MKKGYCLLLCLAMLLSVLIGCDEKEPAGTNVPEVTTHEHSGGETTVPSTGNPGGETTAPSDLQGGETTVPSTGETTEPPVTTAPPPETDPPVTDPPVTEPPKPIVDTAYESIQCVEASGFSEMTFGKKEDKARLTLTLPSDWRFIKRSNLQYEIYRGGSIIGFLTWGDSADPAWEILKTEKKSKNGVDYQVHIEKSTEGDTASYRYRLSFSIADGKEENEMTLCVEYAQLSAFSKSKLQSAVKLKTADSMGFGLVKNSKAKQSVLILGNSFIGSSQVGTIFREMTRNNGKNTSVTAIATGMANVATYAARSDILSDIRSGKYGVLFMCGFYSSSQSDSLDVIEAACKASGTTLVIFPAHNESASAVEYAVSKHPDALYLNWKGELDTLIEGGVDRWDLCVDDAYDHSTELAGYVGAHMIYRAIFGTVPGGSVSNVISQTRVNSLLGDYAKTGAAHAVGDTSAILFE